MRNSIVRRALTAGACAAVMVGLLAGCSDDSDDSSSSSAAPASSAAATSSEAAAATADAATTEAITTAYETFFNGAAPIEERTKYVENSATFGPVLAQMSQNPQAAGTTATVQEITLDTPEHANVTWDLNIGGNPVLPGQAGEAVLVDGTWVVAGVTFCTILAVQGSGEAIPGC